VPAAPGDIAPYLEDSSGYRGEADALFAPSTVEELREILNSASHDLIPITIAGAGTGLTGARVPHGGWILSLDHFRTLRVERGRAICGPGVALADLHRAAAATRQFFGPNPTEISASIGGIIATNAGGARSFRYGPVRRHILALTVTLVDGTTRRVARGERVDFPFQPVHAPDTTKNSAGYHLHPDLDWVDLFCGSEGTLGIITEAEFQLLPEPGAILAGIIFFPSEDDALAAVTAWRALPELRFLEFMDNASLDLLRPRYSEIPSEASAALFIEQNLSSEDDPEIDAWTERMRAQNAIAGASWFALDARGREQFRAFRHALPSAVLDLVRRNGFPKAVTDFAVPLAHDLDLHTRYKRGCEEFFPGQHTIFGHAGDANNHVNLFPTTAAQAMRAEALMQEFAEYVVTLKGTVAAEHGIGKTKTGLLALMYSPEEIASMRAVKQHLDPACLLGRGTIFAA